MKPDGVIWSEPTNWVKSLPSHKGRRQELLLVGKAGGVPTGAAAHYLVGPVVVLLSDTILLANYPTSAELS